ncbi:MAG: GNAT family protein [Pseudomonadota bacterium]
MSDSLPATLELTGKYVVLEPLSLHHLPALSDAVKDGELWKLSYTGVPAPSDFESWFDYAASQREAGKQLPFVVKRLDDQKVVGSTRFYDIDFQHQNVSIGFTWYSASVQRTAVNTECKLLLLSHAFEVCKFNAVYWHTHHENKRSQAAIERLGAKLDGIIRNHKVMPNGSLRDTYSYSMIKEEWPGARAKLSARLKNSGP